MLKGKTIILGVSGGIAAFKIPALISSLKKQHAQVHVILTENARQFITPVTVETLAKSRCITGTFDRNFEFEVEHVALAKKADLFMVAPATANVIAKLACGIADDMLTTTFLAYAGPKCIAPAMNTAMYENPATQENLEKLAKRGIRVLEPADGHLACGENGRGRMPEAEELLEEIILMAAHEKDMAGKKVLVTAGPTREAIDPVRFITNHSSGKMGYALAAAAAQRGASVTLVSGPAHIKCPAGVEKVDVESAAQMAEAVKSRFADTDIVIKAAAVADFTPKTQASGKIKKTGDGLVLELGPTEDILAWLGREKRPGQFVCGFSMETDNVLENSRAKLAKKNADMIAANDLNCPGAGFEKDTNVLRLITAEGVEDLPLLSKTEAGHRILDRIMGEMTRSGGNDIV